MAGDIVLRRIKIENLRVLERVDVELGQGMNGFFGGNGAGKTSFLEGCGMLGLGRSFRTARHGEIIKRGSEFTRVVGEVEENGGRTVIGVERRKVGGAGRINGKRIGGRSELARVVPVLPIDNEFYGLLWAGGRVRRRWLDWVLFHVEPTYGSVLSEFEKVRRQRNSALRKGLPRVEMGFWNAEFVQRGMEVSTYRRAITEELSARLWDLQKGDVFTETELTYEKGWGGEWDGLLDALKRGEKGDRQMGFTKSGPQAANLKFRREGRDAARVFSRGEGKKQALAFAIAAANLWRERSGTAPLLLLDDLSSELDERGRHELARILGEQKGQVILSGVSEADTNLSLTPGARVFHVKQGLIRAVL